MALNRDVFNEKLAPSIEVNYVNVTLLQVTTGKGTIVFDGRDSKKFTYLGHNGTQIKFNAIDYDAIEVLDHISCMVQLTPIVQTKKTTVISFASRENVNLFVAHFHQRSKSERQVRPKYAVNKFARSFHGDKIHGRSIPVCPTESNVVFETGMTCRTVSGAVGYEEDSHFELKSDDSTSEDTTESSSSEHTSHEKSPADEDIEIIPKRKLARGSRSAIRRKNAKKEVN